MPFKKGPHGTLRYYNASNGRFSRYSVAPVKKTKKHKGRGKEMADRKRQELLNRANNSTDPYIKEVSEALDSAIPYCLQHINEQIYNKKTKRPQEIDIITKNLVIEVKTGNGKKKLRQFLNQMDISKDIKRTHVVYAPSMKNGARQEYEKHGIKIVSTIEELIQMEKTK